MTELEKVEKLREKANVSYSEAREALALSNGDLLDALIYLEEQGKAKAPQGGGYYSGGSERSKAQGGERTRHRGKDQEKERRASSGEERRSSHSGESFPDLLRRFGRFCLDLLNKGIVNYLDATRNGELLFSCPVIVLIALLVCFFWFTVPVFLISLFFGVRYRFSGPDMGRESINKVMDSTSDMADDVKRSFNNESNREKDNN